MDKALQREVAAAQRRMPSRRSDRWRRLGDFALRAMQYAHTVGAAAAVIGFVLGTVAGRFGEAAIMPFGFVANVAFATLFRRARRPGQTTPSAEGPR